MEAVPLFGCVLPPYPPQPPIARTSATIASDAVAVGSAKDRAIRNFPPLDIARISKLKTTNKAHGPITAGTKNPYRATFLEVLIVSVVVAVPLAELTVAGLKAQLMPKTGEQENVTLFTNPPTGVTVS